MAHVNSVGAFTWAISPGVSSGFNQLRASGSDGSGGALVTGQFSGSASFGPTILRASGGRDVFVAHVSRAGAFDWAIKTGGSSSESATDIASDGAGGAFVVGSLSGASTFGSTTLNNSGLGNGFDDDMFVLRVSVGDPESTPPSPLLLLSPSTPPPPQSPVAPPGVPGASIVTRHNAYFSMTVAGDVSDFTNTKIDEMATLLADEVNISRSAVELTVSSASVIITAKVTTTQAAQDHVVTQLNAALGTVTHATSFFSSVSGGGVVVISAPTVFATTEVLPGDAPPSSPPPSASIPVVSGNGSGAGALVGIITGVGITGIGLFAWLLRARKKPPGRSPNDSVVEAVTFTHNVRVEMPPGHGTAAANAQELTPVAATGEAAKESSAEPVQAPIGEMGRSVEQQKC